MKYIIYLGYHKEYFSGKTYIFQGALYSAEADRDNAKRYKSKKVAERVAERLWRKTENCRLRPVVVEVNE